MSVFWSGQDNACVKGLANGGYLLSLVVNKARESMMRLDVFHPAHLTISDLVWEVHCPLDQETYAECLMDFQAKVKETGKWANLPISAVDFLDQTYLEQLKQAKENGSLTEEELQEELAWLHEEGDF
jgi:hypothetical protein